MTRTSRLIVAPLLSLALLACQGSELEPPIGSDTSGDSTETDTDSDTTTDTGADPCDDPSNKVLTWSLVTRDGEQAADEITLTAADEPEKYEATPGFQVDVIGKILCVDAGETVRLIVDGTTVAQGLTVLDDDMVAGVTFESVFIPNADAPILATMSADLETGVVAVDKTITTDFKACVFVLTVARGTEGCGDLTTAGGEQGVTVTVARTEGECDRASVEYVFDGNTQMLAETTLDAAGAAMFFLPLGTDAQDLSGDLEITATILHPTTDLLGSTNSETVAIDNVAPALALDAVPEPFTPADDANAALAGLQLVLTGTTDLTGTGAVELFVDSTSVATTTAENGTFTFPELTFDENAIVEIRAAGTEACGLSAEASATVTVLVVVPDIAIMSPTDGATLLAVDDTDAATPDVYETSFDIAVNNAAADATVTVTCADVAAPGLTEVVGFASFDTDAATTTVTVSLNTATLGLTPTCFASVDLPIALNSASIGFTIAIPAPTLTLTAPVADACITGGSVTVAGAATALDGQAISVVVSGQGAATTTGTATADAYSVDADVSAVPDGDYTLTLDATDSNGNVVSATQTAPTVVVGIDANGPMLAFTAPATMVTLDSDSDAVTDGYQTDVVISVSDVHADGGSVTLNVNGADLTPIAVTMGATSVTFEDVALIGGGNTFITGGMDGCGNATADVTQVTTLVVDGPTVAVTAPSADLLTGDDTVDISVTVTAAAGGGDVADATVTLLKDDGTGTFVDTGLTATDDGSGVFTFAGVALTADAANAYRVDADLNGAGGMSAVRTVTQKSATPTITVTVPMAGLVNLASAGCDATAFPTGDCQVNAQVTTVAVEEGQEATLTVECGAGPVNYMAMVTSDAATFEDVILTDGATCLVDATVADVIAQVADAAQVMLNVDRTAPTLAITSPSQANLTSADDNNFGVDGIQHPIRATVGGVSDGVTVTAVVDDGTTQTSLTFTTLVDTRASGTEVADFGLFDYTDGDYTVTVSASDAAGNPASASAMTSVSTATIDLKIQSPEYTGIATCSDASPCALGFCNAGSCYDPFGITDARQLIVNITGIAPMTPDNLRVCSDSVLLAGGTACNSGDGSTYFQVAEFTVEDGFRALNLSGSVLPEGFQTLIVEGLITAGGAYLSSLGEADATERRRRVYVDSVAPMVTAISFPGDVEAPTDTLNAAEQSSPGLFDLSVTSDSAGTVEIFVHNVSAGTFDVVAGANTVSIALPEGDIGAGNGVDVYAVVTDIGENNSVSRVEGATVVIVTVDTVAPSLAIATPAMSPLNASSNLDVRITSDADGASVTLTDAIEGGSTMDYMSDIAAGQVVFDDATFGILVDGSHTLTATITDAAGNTTNAATTPAVIIVDRTAPTGAITSPADLAVLDDGDDASADPGFQVTVDFTTGDGATMWRLERESGCDAAFENCAEAVEVASGAVTNAGGAEPQVVVSLVLDAPTTFRRITLTAVDDAGNAFTDVVSLTVLAADCLVSLAGLPTGDWYNAAACATGNSCASAAVTVTVQVTGVCAPIDTIELRDGATVLGSAAFGAGSADFDITINDGDMLDFQGVALDAAAAEVALTGVESHRVDLTPPSATFEAAAVDGFMTTAEGATTIYTAAMDQDTAAAGMQFNAQALLSDANLEGGQIVSLTATGAGGPVSLMPANVSLPFALAAGVTQTQTLLALTLADSDTYVVELTIEDEAGNPATSSFITMVDISPPSEVVIDNILIVSKSRPRTHLRFTEPEDGSGAAVERYETRFSPNPIDEDNFDAACDGRDLGTLSTVPNPVAPGMTAEWRSAGPTALAADDPCKYVATIQGPQDPDSVRWHFAVRAIDAAGNVSPLGSTSLAELTFGEVWLQQGTIDFDAALFGAGVGPFVTLGGRILGDLNGDGNDDVIVGFDVAAVGLPNAFCVMYGPLVPDSTVDDLEGPNWRCANVAETDYFPGETVTKLASAVERAGDINGDGRDDFMVTGRISGTLESNCDGVDGDCLTGEGFALYFLGRDGDITNLDLTAPAVSVRGLAFSASASSAYVAGCGAGDFNGDGADDLAFGQPALNQVHVMAGDSTWDDTTSIVVDMTDANAPVTHTIFTVRTNYANSPASTGGQFANRCDTAGDVLTANGSDGKADLLVRKGGNNPSLQIFAGRTFAGGDSVCTTEGFGPATAACDAGENASTVRLQQDAGNTSPGGVVVAGFGGSFQSALLTRDLIPDILVAHRGRRPAASNVNCASADDMTCGKSVYIFDGSKFDAAVGGFLRVGSVAGADATDDFWVGTNGSVLRAVPGQFYGSVRAIGNWDQYFASPIPGTDLLIGSDTSVSLRTSQLQAGYAMGEFPFTDIEFVGNPNSSQGLFQYGGWVDGGTNLVGRNDSLRTLDLLIGGGGGQLVIIY